MELMDTGEVTLGTDNEVKFSVGAIVGRVASMVVDSAKETLKLALGSEPLGLEVPTLL